MFCTKCGNELPVNAKFCTKCGTKVEAFQPGAIQTNPTPQPQPKKTEQVKKQKTVKKYQIKIGMRLRRNPAPVPWYIY